MFSIAIAAEQKYTQRGDNGPWYDDRELQEELEERGHQVEIIAWEDLEIDLCRFDSIFVSSTWNMCREPQQFRTWLNKCEQDHQRRLINDREVLDAGFEKAIYWKVIKQILSDNPYLEKLGQLTPSRYFTYSSPHTGSPGVESLEPGLGFTEVLAGLDADLDWKHSNLVLKPIISGDGHDTFVYNRFNLTIPVDDKKQEFVLDDAEKAGETFQRLIRDTKRSGVCIQTYMKGVEEGEYSLTILGRKCTHAVQKPKLFKGDGSSRRRFISLEQLPDGMLRFAEEIVRHFDDKFGRGSVSRARVDLFNQSGVPTLCELECVEPNTNLAIVAKAYQDKANEALRRYADVIERRTQEILTAR